MMTAVIVSAEAWQVAYGMPCKLRGAVPAVYTGTLARRISGRMPSTLGPRCS